MGYSSFLSLTNNECITFHALTGLLGLTSLDLSDTPLSSRPQSPFCLSVLTNLTTLNLSNNWTVTDEGLLGLTNLKTLMLRIQSRITDASLSQMTQLTALDLAGNTQITNASVSLLTDLQSLSLQQWFP
jgi:hypothetical protein